MLYEYSATKIMSTWNSSFKDEDVAYNLNTQGADVERWWAEASLVDHVLKELVSSTPLEKKKMFGPFVTSHTLNASSRVAEADWYLWVPSQLEVYFENLPLI